MSKLITEKALKKNECYNSNKALIAKHGDYLAAAEK